jgi:small subunit ribosomal protein S4
MARMTEGKCRLCRREGELLYLKGARCYTEKCAVRRRETPPGAGLRRRRRRLSEYGMRLREKQKLKRIYGVLERQFRRVFEEAKRQKGNTGENLLLLLERRLDNTLYSMGFAPSRAMARQMIGHGHVAVNGKRATIASMMVRAGDTVTPYDRERSKTLFKSAVELASGIRPSPAWVAVDESGLTGNVIALPKREDIPFEVNELFVVEVCSR